MAIDGVDDWMTDASWYYVVVSHDEVMTGGYFVWKPDCRPLATFSTVLLVLSSIAVMTLGYCLCRDELIDDMKYGTGN